MLVLRHTQSEKSELGHSKEEDDFSEAHSLGEDDMVSAKIM